MVNMAYVACQSLPVSPNYRPSRHSERGHGAVSEYETLDVVYKKHTKVLAASDIPEEVIPLVTAPPCSWPSSVLQADQTLNMLTEGNIHKTAMNEKTSVPSLPKPDPNLCITPEQSLTTISRVISHKTRNKMVPVQPTLLQPEPLLAITPEKAVPAKSKTKSNLRTCQNETESKQKMKHKVRFDISSSDIDFMEEGDTADINLNSHHKSLGSKVYHPKLYSEMVKSNDAFFDSGDQTITLAYTADPIKENCDMGSTCKVSLNDKVPETSNMDLFRPTHEMLFTTVDSKPHPSMEYTDRSAITIPDTNKGHPKQKVVVTREFQECPVFTEYQYPFCYEEAASDVEHVFSRPEFHNSLKVYGEIKELGSTVPDVATTLLKHLQGSEEKRVEISEKASAKVNARFSSSQYTGLVELEAPIVDLCQITEKQKSLKSAKYQLRKPATEREPGLIDIFHLALEKEAMDLNLTGMNTPNEALTTAPQSMAFDLYRHNRVWEGMSWN